MGGIPPVRTVGNTSLSPPLREETLKSEVAIKKAALQKAVASYKNNAKAHTKPSQANPEHGRHSLPRRNSRATQQRVLPEYDIAQNPLYPWGAGAKDKHQELFPRVLAEGQGSGPKDEGFRVKDQDFRLTNLNLKFFNHDRHAQFVFTNENSNKPLKLTGIYVGKQTGERVPDVTPGTQRKVTFGGKDTVEIPPGGKAVSDFIELDFAGKRPANASATVALSYHVDGESGPVSWYSFGSGLSLRSYVSQQTQHPNTGVPDAQGLTPINSTFFFAGANVIAPSDGFRVKVAGNSIGAGESTEIEDSDTTPGSHSWPKLLDDKLGRTYNIYKTTNASRPGNQYDGDDASGGPAGKKAANDLANMRAGDFLIVASGTNDIRFRQGMTAQMYVDALKETERLCREKGVIFIAATVPSAKGEHQYGYGEGDPLRLEINTKIRSTFGSRHVLDIDKATTNRTNGALDDEYVNHLDRRKGATQLVERPGDNVHPNALWHQRVATLAKDLIDLHTPNPRLGRLNAEYRAGIARKRHR